MKCEELMVILQALCQLMKTLKYLHKSTALLTLKVNKRGKQKHNMWTFTFFKHEIYFWWIDERAFKYRNITFGWRRRLPMDLWWRLVNEIIVFVPCPIQFSMLIGQRNNIFKPCGLSCNNSLKYAFKVI